LIPSQILRGFGHHSRRGCSLLGLSLSCSRYTVLIAPDVVVLRGTFATPTTITLLSLTRLTPLTRLTTPLIVTVGALTITTITTGLSALLTGFSALLTGLTTLTGLSALLTGLTTLTGLSALLTGLTTLTGLTALTGLAALLTGLTSLTGLASLLTGLSALLTGLASLLTTLTGLTGLLRTLWRGRGSRRGRGRCRGPEEEVPETGQKLVIVQLCPKPRLNDIGGKKEETTEEVVPFIVCGVHRRQLTEESLAGAQLHDCGRRLPRRRNQIEGRKRLV
jgi:hypothetical protein